MTLQLLWQAALAIVNVEQIATAAAVGGGSLIAALIGSRLVRRKHEGELFTDTPATRDGFVWLVMVAVATAIATTGVWMGQATLVLCSLIATHGSCGLIHAAWVLVLITREQRASKKTYKLVKKLHLEKMTRNQLTGSVLGVVLDQLRCLGDCRADVNVRSLVEAQTSAFWSGLSAVVSAANVATAMGLLGTVIGLTQMFGSLAVALKAKDQAVGDAALNDAMAGIGAAFYTTIIGAFVSGIVLQVLATIGERKLQRLENDVTSMAERCWFKSGGPKR